MFKLQKLSYLPFKRLLSTTSLNVLEPLKERTLIRVAGSEAANFLQGLMTNDVEHLKGGASSMYTMFLNSMGRILYDTIIYTTSEQNVYFIECDGSIADTFKKHLTLHKVRRKIDISHVGDEYQIFVAFSEDGKLVINLRQEVALSIFKDPRVADLGYRIITNSDDILKTSFGVGLNFVSPSKFNYRWLRYKLGVGEGTIELPPSESFPLECNCDYLHGVSFYKGCYVGQELTARIHHTGVIRKRLMPIHFIKTPTKTPDSKIVHENVNLGKLRGLESDVGLGLIRIDKALAFSEIKIGDGIATTCKPQWWPVEAPKEKMNVS